MAVSGLAAGLVLFLVNPFPSSVSAGPGAEVIGRARTNNRSEVVTFLIDTASAFVREVRVRSGGQSMLLVAVEIDFADGGSQRSAIGETLAPGRQSRAIGVDSWRAIHRITVVKRPGLRAGETEIQVIAVPANRQR